jgi:hypothetical protein
VRDSLAAAKNGERRVVLQLLLYGVKSRLCHGNVEATLEQLERLSFDLDLDHESSGQHTLRQKQQMPWIPERAHVLLLTQPGSSRATLRSYFVIGLRGSDRPHPDPWGCDTLNR